MNQQQGDDDIRKTIQLFSDLKGKNPNFVDSVLVDEESKIRALMWTDGKSLHQYKFFGDAITLTQHIVPTSTTCHSDFLLVSTITSRASYLGEYCFAMKLRRPLSGCSRNLCPWWEGRLQEQYWQTKPVQWRRLYPPSGLIPHTDGANGMSCKKQDKYLLRKFVRCLPMKILCWR